MTVRFTFPVKDLEGCTLDVPDERAQVYAEAFEELGMADVVTMEKLHD